MRALICCVAPGVCRCGQSPWIATAGFDNLITAGAQVISEGRLARDYNVHVTIPAGGWTWLPVRLIVMLLLCGMAVRSQTVPQAAGWADHSILEPVHAQLPEWLRFGGEYRVRWEGFDNLGFQPENDDYHALHRVRLNLQIKPAGWMRLFVQGQDARVWGVDHIGHVPPYQDTLDLRQAYVELGSDAGTAKLRTGRQEFAFGEERLVGASNWANAARTFDAVRLDVRASGARISMFASSVVVTREGGFDQHAQGNNLHGAYGSFDHLVPLAKVEPFLFWRVAPRVRGENGASGKLDSRTVGVRIAGIVSKKLAYVTEMAVQRGNSAADDISAWAGHWRIERLLSQTRSPKLRLEYNYATGDRTPGDTTYNTFDVLYPTPHDKYGLADQVGWKNIHHAAAIFEVKPLPRWTLQAKFHTWWLASARDGLYNAPGSLLVRDASGASGRHVGEEIDIQGLWNAGKQLFVGGGFGHMFPGAFLNKTSPGATYSFPYIMVTYTF